MRSVIGDTVCFFPHPRHLRADLIPAKDYVEGMWLILQQQKPDDFVLATGETHAVREYVEKAFRVLGTEIKYVSMFAPRSLVLKVSFLRWQGHGVNEEGYDAATGKVVVRVDERYFRPAEVECATFRLAFAVH